jgi:DNA polymerase IIIc chi subunit
MIKDNTHRTVILSCPCTEEAKKKENYMWRGGFFTFTYSSGKNGDEPVSVYYSDYTRTEDNTDMILNIQKESDKVITYKFINSAGKMRQSVRRDYFSHVFSREEARVVWNELTDQGWAREPKASKAT